MIVVVQLWAIFEVICCEESEFEVRIGQSHQVFGILVVIYSKNFLISTFEVICNFFPNASFNISLTLQNQLFSGHLKFFLANSWPFKVIKFIPTTSRVFILWHTFLYWGGHIGSFHFHCTWGNFRGMKCKKGDFKMENSKW